jgi:hypothetical protein
MLGGGIVARWGVVALLGALLLLGGYAWILDRRNGALELQAARDARSITALEAARAQARLAADVAAARAKGAAAMRDQTTAGIKRLRNLQLEGCAD